MPDRMARVVLMVGADLGPHSWLVEECHGVLAHDNIKEQHRVRDKALLPALQTDPTPSHS